MRIDLDNLEYEGSRFCDSDLSLFFDSIGKSESRHVLYCKNVIAFFDLIVQKDDCKVVRIDRQGGTFNMDLSIRLKNEEIRSFPEVFIFKDDECVDFVFRCVSEEITWEELDDKFLWM